MSLHLYNFCGHCSLYSNGVYIEEDGRFEPNWSTPFYCGFTLFVGSLILLVAFIQLIRKLIFLYKGTDSSFLSALIDAVIAFIFTVLVLIDAVIVSRGFAIWCNAVTQRFDSCETASSVMIIGKNSDIDPKGFFIQLGSVQFGIWMLLVGWVLLLVLAARKLFVYHERENIIVSMARSRQQYTAPDYTPITN